MRTPLGRSALSSTIALGFTIVLAGGTATAEDRYEDAVGDATGDSPDIVAVTVSEEDGMPPLSVSVEFAEGRAFGTDMETWSDVVFLLMSADPTLDERGILEAEYSTGTHGVALPRQLDTGAMLDTPEGLYWAVVDVAQDGELLTFTLDRKLIGSPQDIHLQVLVGVERFDEEDGAEAEGELEGDMFPDEGEPPVSVRLNPVDR